MPVTLYELLGLQPTQHAEAAKIWPRSRIKTTLGASVDSEEDAKKLVSYLQDVLRFRAVRPGAEGGRVGLVAEVSINNAMPEDLRPPIVLTQMPDVTFILLDTVPPTGQADDLPVRVFVTHGESGAEVVLENVPVKIVLPNGLLGALAGVAPAVDPSQKFEAGLRDSLRVSLGPHEQAAIEVHLRVRITEELDIVLEPAVPISIGPCRFHGLPCRGLHDLSLVASPRLHGNHDEREQALEWARHPLDRLSPDAKYAGQLTVRSVDLDVGRTPFKELLDRFNAGRAGDNVDLVLEDLAFPFFNLAGFPLPSHGLFGVRRKIKEGDKLAEAFSFKGAPISFQPWSSLWVIVEQLMVQSPASLDPLDQFLFLQASFSPKRPTPPTQPREFAGTLGVSEDWTIQLGGRSSEGEMLFEVLGATVKLFGAKLGLSLKRAVEHEQQGLGFADMTQLLLDVGLSTKAGDGAIFRLARLRSVSGGDVQVVLREIGWNLGSLKLLPDGASVPNGLELSICDVVKLVVEEISWVTENNGGQYISFTGGVDLLRLGNPTGAGHRENGLRVYRLRFRTGGRSDAPDMMIDGASLSIILGAVALKGYGYLGEYRQDGIDYKEFGFGLMAGLELFAKRLLVGAAFFHGSARGPGVDFDYWQIGAIVSPIPLGVVDLINVRALVAGNMTPNLPPPEGYAQNMRLFRWYRSNPNSIAAPPVSGDRRLAAWVPKDDSFALGIGAGIAWPIGKIAVLDIFVFFDTGPDHTGLLIAGEVYLFRGKQPVGYVAIEVDFGAGKFGFMLGVELTVKNVLGDFPVPSFLERIATLTGSLYVGNEPWTFAIGQLNDAATWLTYRVGPGDIIIWNSLLEVAVCIQIVDRPEGPKGCGLIFTLQGGAVFGIGRTEFYLHFAFMAGVWRNESRGSGFKAVIEAALRIKVFFVFNFGISVKIDLEFLGPAPTYRRAGFQFRIETPWWLPDVTFRFDKVWESPQPGKAPVISSPLTGSGALDPGTRRNESLLVTAPGGGGLEEQALFNMDQVRAMVDPTVPEGELAKLTPIAIDATIGLDFKPSLDNKTTVGGNTPFGAGAQAPTAPAVNDLKTTYELVEMGIRRRPRFGAGAGTWTDLLTPQQTRLEGPADFPPGTQLEAKFAPKVNAYWDEDVQRENALDPRRLLINAETPYSFLTKNPEGDENRARSDPGWPCCLDDMYGIAYIAPAGLWHELNFEAIPFGERAPAHQAFPGTSSSLHWLIAPTPIVAPGQAAGSSSHPARIRYSALDGGVVASISFDRPVRILHLSIAWAAGGIGGKLFLEAFSGLHLIDQQDFALSTSLASGTITCESTGGFSSAQLRYEAATGANPSAPPEWIDLVAIRYSTVEAQLEVIARKQRCLAHAKRSIEGGGKLAWLPNHDYEVSVATRLILEHRATGLQEARVKQTAYFRTKGLPGLNAVPRVGDELEPFVESRYPAPAMPLLYRAEPLMLAFNEKFNVLLPMDVAPSPDNPAELQQATNRVLEWVLAVDRVGGADGAAPVSRTSEDWIEVHRQTVSVQIRPNVAVLAAAAGYPVAGTVVREASSLDPYAQRFDQMKGKSCGVAVPSLRRSQVIVHDPVEAGPAGEPIRQLWEADRSFVANVRRKGGPFVSRVPFYSGDDTAFDFADKGYADGTGWTVDKGAMQVKSSLGIMRFREGMGRVSRMTRHYAVFGEVEWNHVQVRAVVNPGGGMAGIAFGVAGVPKQVVGARAVTRAVLAVIDGGSRSLRLVEVDPGGEHQLASAPLPADLTAPFGLEVSAYDDLLRARVGEVVVESPRGGVREGRLGLVADGGGVFESLIVEPLDAYRLEFRSSRFTNFEAHIGSFGGGTTLIPQRAMQPAGPASATVASLLAATGSQIAGVMSKGGDPERRQRLFDQWAAGLVLPLRQDLKALAGLELSRLVQDDGRTAVFVLESPEPLSLSQDVTLVLSERTPVYSGNAGVWDLIQGAPWLSSLDFDDLQVAASLQPPSGEGGLGRLRWLVRAEQVGDEIEYRVYDARVAQTRRGAVQLSGEAVEVTRTPRGKRHAASPLLKGMVDLKPGHLVALDEAGDLLIPGPVPVLQWTYVEQPTHVLTNGSETCALIVPVSSAGGSAPLSSSTYRFTFKLDRARFRQQTPDNVSNYRAQSSFIIRW